MENLRDVRVEPDLLSAVLEHDHRDIDQPIEGFLGDASASGRDRVALAGAVRELRRHIYIEEELLFPPLRRAGLIGPIMVMLREHAQMWQTLDLLDSLLQAHAPDIALQNTCRELTIQLNSHNPKEEQILYPQADVLLSPSEQGRLRAFFESGQRPEGWTCTQLLA